MTQHTQGQWKYHKADRPGMNQEYDYLIHIGTRHVAEVFQYQNHENNIGKEEVLANARLIAAAPQLLEALKTVQAEYEKMHMESIAKSLVDVAIKEADND